MMSFNIFCAIKHQNTVCCKILVWFYSLVDQKLTVGIPSPRGGIAAAAGVFLGAHGPGFQKSPELGKILI